MIIDKEIKRLERLLENNWKSCLPWTWREDLPVIPLGKVIEMLKNIREDFVFESNKEEVQE